ncbi:hypothetical protein G7046_g901 [Stylonectria norvegica]|nr:hypothetical protein G7046_g901 [Stylonectria norvegica]
MIFQHSETAIFDNFNDTYFPSQQMNKDKFFSREEINEGRVRKEGGRASRVWGGQNGGRERPTLGRWDAGVEVLALLARRGGSCPAGALLPVARCQLAAFKLFGRWRHGKADLESLSGTRTRERGSIRSPPTGQDPQPDLGWTWAGLDPREFGKVKAGRWGGPALIRKGAITFVLLQPREKANGRLQAKGKRPVRKENRRYAEFCLCRFEQGTGRPCMRLEPNRIHNSRDMVGVRVYTLVTIRWSEGTLPLCPVLCLRVLILNRTSDRRVRIRVFKAEVDEESVPQN